MTHDAVQSAASYTQFGAGQLTDELAREYRVIRRQNVDEADPLPCDFSVRDAPDVLLQVRLRRRNREAKMELMRDATQRERLFFPAAGPADHAQGDATHPLAAGAEGDRRHADDAADQARGAARPERVDRRVDSRGGVTQFLMISIANRSTIACAVATRALGAHAGVAAPHRSPRPDSGRARARRPGRGSTTSSRCSWRSRARCARRTTSSSSSRRGTWRPRCSRATGEVAITPEEWERRVWASDCRRCATAA